MTLYEISKTYKLCSICYKSSSAPQFISISSNMSTSRKDIMNATQTLPQSFTNSSFSRFTTFCWRIDYAMRALPRNLNSITCAWWQLRIYYDLVSLLFHYVANSHWALDAYFPRAQLFCPSHLRKHESSVSRDSAKCVGCIGI